MRKLLGHVWQYRFRRPTLTAVACAATLAGIAVARHHPMSGAGWLFAPIGVVIVRGRWQNVAILLALLCAGFGLGIWRGTAFAHRLAVYDGLWKQKIVLVGAAQDDAVYGTHQQLTFPLSGARLAGPQLVSLPGVISVSGFGVPAVFRGDLIEVHGELYPTRGDNQARISFATLQVLAHRSNWIGTVRERFVAGVQSALPEPAASFGLGLLIGQRNTLPTAVSQQLTMVGLTHIIAVSGYNLTIMLQAARRLVGKRSKFQATALFVALVGLFALLAGSSPSIVRAAIVSLLSIAAWYYGREIRPLNLLLLAAAITGLTDPLYVWGNVSWYLSFLAFGGVLLLAPLMVKRWFRSRQPGLMLTVLIESFCAEILTVPYVLHVFGQASLVALPANLLIVPLVPLGMLLSLAAGLAGMIVSGIAGWVAWPAQIALTYMLDAAHLLSRVPHAFLTNIGFSERQMLVAYIIALCMSLVLWRSSHKTAIITDEIAQKSRGV